jgi:hypothetical protein
MKKLPGQWLPKAEHDVLVARHLFKMKPLLTDEICFHCQQAVEKLFKGMLAERGLPIQKTHDLTILLAQLLPTDPTLRSLRRGLKGVTPLCRRVSLPWHEHLRPPGADRLPQGAPGPIGNPQTPRSSWQAHQLIQRRRVFCGQRKPFRLD